MIITLLFGFSSSALAQVGDCYATLINDTLTVANSQIVVQWRWNAGDILLLSANRTAESTTFNWENDSSSLYLSHHPFLNNISIEIDTISTTYANPAHLQVIVLNQHQGLRVKRILRIFPETPAISYDYHLQYEQLSINAPVDSPDRPVDGTEAYFGRGGDQDAHLLHLNLPSPHWRITAVDFKDRTDENNTLIYEQNLIPYRSDHFLNGNLLLATDLESQRAFFVLKEAPSTTSQLNYPAFDFALSKQGIRVPFSGYPIVSTVSGWIKGYTTTVGFSGKEDDIRYTLRTYLKNSTRYTAANEMIMMNTWGDRGRDEKISEAFILQELEAAHRLGITHFQIDDGWQQGLSANSYDSTGALWDAWKPEDWQPHRVRFPNGLAPVVQSAEQKGIQLGLWFHPSNHDHYAKWEQDADVIIKLHQLTGIRYFKIDGLKVSDKLAEVNLLKFFDRVKLQTNGAVFFNLDLTAGVRGGYFVYRNLGNLFLENRYSDWGNYYPYQTLRNLWMLSKYFPPELLQIEFLNNYRNGNKYATNDRFAPSHYSIDYLFAITLAGQPLAWFEATGLPPAAFGVAEQIEKYKKVQADFHAGHIFPIGDEPSGRSWTGFQSARESEGYFLVYREENDEDATDMQVHLPEGTTLELSSILGETNAMKDSVVVGNNRQVRFALPKANTYALYHYRIKE